MKKNLLAILVMLALAASFILVGCGSDDDDANDNTAPGTPGNFAAAQSARNSVSLSWSSVSKNSLDAGADSVHLERSTNGETWTDLVSLIGSATQYTDATILTGRQYWYRIHALNSYGESETTTTSIWTWPSVYDFSTDQTANFTRRDDDPNGVYTTWTYDGAGQAGKFTVNVPTDNAYRLSHLVTDYQVPGQGVFETKFKIGDWYESGANYSEVGIFIETDFTNANDNVVGVYLSADSTVFGHYTGGSFIRDGFSAALQDNAFHTLRAFHSGNNWKWYIDGTLALNVDLPNVIASGNVYVEYQYDRGNSGPIQEFWVDDTCKP